jgi:hypothetical protein
VWVGGAEPTEVVVQGADASPQALAAASRSLIGKWDVWDGRMTLTFHDDGTFHFVNFQPPHQQAIDVLDGKWKVHGKSLTARATSGWEGTFEIENITPTAFSLRQMAWTYTGKKIQ